MTHKIAIKGYRVKDGKLVRSYKHLSVSAQLQKRASKSLRVVRPGTIKAPAKRPSEK